jgi:hypothetical protein
MTVEDSKLSFDQQSVYRRQTKQAYRMKIFRTAAAAAWVQIIWRFVVVQMAKLAL